MEINESGMKGMYCMAKVKPDENSSQNFEAKSSLQSASPAGNYYDPYFSICLPSGCSINDVAKLVQSGKCLH